MKNLITSIFFLLFLQGIHAQDSVPQEILWEINRLDTIGNLPVELIGNPILIDTDEGKAVEFDGVNDGLLVGTNPLAGASEFTIEVVFKPYPGGLEEQRFVHIEQDNSNRALIELRSTEDDGWFLDTFIKSGSSARTLYADGYVHETNRWWHAALVYKNDTMTHYVNGEKEMSGTVEFSEVSSGKTSLGVRQNLVSWFKGAIKTLKVTHKALSPEAFTMTGIQDTLTTASQINKNRNLRSAIYPNPVTSIAHIHYRLDKPAQVLLEVYNIQMIKVAELVNADQDAGNYSKSFYREKLPAGIYFYDLKVGQERTVEKFQIVD